MICEDNVVAGGHFDGGVSIVGNSQVLFEDLVSEARIRLPELLKNFLGKLAVGLRAVILLVRCCIRNADFEVSVGLVLDGLKHFPKELFGGLVNRNHNGELRLQREGCIPLLLKLRLCHLLLFVPLVVIVVLLNALQAMDGFLVEGSEAVLLEVIPSHFHCLPMKQRQKLFSFFVSH